MCMYAKLIEHNLVGQPEIRKANFGGDHTPYGMGVIWKCINLWHDYYDFGWAKNFARW